ncbi:B12-binding domain-containing radical SAM protein [Sandaracinus amylolyticus]|uniref:B12-binding domain-containing radical SAM protein n=1 Tax=Sandaracinus amylolyticus TaxID=927083 RepID=UPI001F182E3A|nr:radical SAM protein [Sandaracinus amylolyticus]UJR84371.1 Hypothetical protein I5071_64500 [Sandaracinus amylolyticus]
MRALFLNPPGPDGVPYIREGRCEQRLSSYAYRMLPISLPSTAGALREHGHVVEILDACGPRVPASSLEGRVRAFRPDLVVVSVSTPTYSADLETIDALARWVPKAHLTAIGVHVTALPDEALRASRLSSVVRGEPEWTVTELAECLARGGDPSTVIGLSFRRGDEIVHNGDRPFDGDLDELPEPARDLLPEQDYFLPVFNKPYTLVVPTRGCPHKCTYCTAPSYYGKKLRRRAPKRVVDEMEAIVRRGVVKDITMWSDTFTLDRRYVIEVCDEIVRRRLDVHWMCNSRADCMDPELARIMRRAGCVGISFGLESGVQEILDRAKKGTTVEQGRAAVEATKSAGISTLGHFILGLPGETRETVRRTVSYAIEVDPDWAQFYCATPLPGTALRAEAEREGALVGGDWSELELHRPSMSTSTMSASELERQRRWAYLAFYGRPRVARRVLGRMGVRDVLKLGPQAASFVRSWVWDA